jgi:tetrahedral aminopeptidase
MTDISPFLKSLLSSAGLSGYESPVADLIRAHWQPLADEIQTSRLGSIHALRKGTAPAPRPALLISAHMDAVGLMVAGIQDGFLQLTEVGGIDPRLLPGLSVLVHGRQPLLGVIVARPPLLMPDDDKKNAVGFDHLFVDVGLKQRRVQQLVRVGDLVSFANEPIELGDGILSGHSLDNRASVAALNLSLEALQANRHAWDVWFAASVQEEISYAGGATSAFSLRPALAIVVDVTYGKGAGSNGWEYFPLGGGPTLGIGPHIHPLLLKHLRALAEKLEIPYSIEPMPETSFTETDAIQLSAAGIPTAVVSIPIRYMHTPVEVVDLTDIQRTARLLAEFVAGLEAVFLDSFQWTE